MYPSVLKVGARQAAAGLLFLLSGHLGPAPAQTPFYNAQRSSLAGQPGTIVRQERIDGAPLEAAAYRTLYRSTGLNGEPIFVSGVIVVPQGDSPPGGRPIVAWAHPTSGVTPRCAPSLAIFLFQQIQGLRSFVERGYVVAATDYPGLGTPETHPYLVGDSEARAVIDIVRAASGMPGAGGGKRFTVWGHSQGGQAALFTGMIVKSYAPEFELLGVAAAAPATDLAALMKDDIGTSGGNNIMAMTLWSWHRVFDASLAKTVDPRALPTLDRLARVCIEGPFDLSARQRIGQALNQQFLSVDQPADIEPWRSLLEKNSAGVLPSEIPVFLAQGTTDQIIKPNVTRDYMSKLCGAGSKVKLMILPNIGHGRAAQASTMAAVNWTSDRFAGAAVPDDCAR
ncbi:alpha/beta fold hydrolase [Bradyrhizobium sp. ma5]|uniref:alpha/beta fold hydrolase n=1 Tax=Bradyrhizobium sp. ma5 TaxID=3344828 RepID=UPI0035D4EB7C